MTSLPAFLAFFTRSRKAPAPHLRGIAPVPIQVIANNKKRS